MTSRMKGDEKNEKIIRGLLKLPGNKRCINCNSLGPQYVCTNFWTFICMNCSGVHREFTHRVKSVSMAKFSTQEVTALQEGGNERAREMYFKQWDPQRQSFPDSSNVDRLREFIRHVYVERRYAGERNADGALRTRDSHENKKSDAYQQGGSRSPPYDERNFKSSYEERRSPSQYGRSPGRPDSADERRMNDNQNRAIEDRRFPNGPPRSEAKTGDVEKDSKLPSPPMIRPVQDILGEDPPPLRVGSVPSQTDATKTINGSLETQRAASSNSLASVDSSSTEVKRVDLGSLIDFDATPEPSAPEPSKDSRASSTGDWASFDSMVQPKSPRTSTSNLSPLESALSGLSVSSVSTAKTLPNSGIDLFSSANAVVQPTPPSMFQPSQNRPSEIRPISAPSSQSQVSLFAPTNHQSGLVIASQPAVENQNSGRKELPADLFTGAYPSPAFPRWHVGPRIPMGYVMQYPPAMAAVPSFPPAMRSTNPFDFSAESTTPQANAFPQMPAVQVARPSSGGGQGGSLGGMSTAPYWTLPQRTLSYPPAAQPFSPRGFPPQSAPFHQMPGSFPPLGQGQVGPAFGSPPSADHPSSGGGNPFS